jgi:hypothetical protein
VSDQQASEPVTRGPDDIVEDAPEHRRRTTRQDRHATRTQLHMVAGDDEAMEDVDLASPPPHDLGRRASPRPPKSAKPGRRGGFKVWKTRFWKRRRSLWAEKNAATKRLIEEE